jgi:hypothetical protein
MRGGGRGGDARAVGTAERIRAVIEIERAERTISGQLTINDAPARGFFGWLELIDLLERASSPSAAPPCARQDPQVLG